MSPLRSRIPKRRFANREKQRKGKRPKAEIITERMSGSL
jgi:hypothetical protein